MQNVKGFIPGPFFAFWRGMPFAGTWKKRFMKQNALIYGSLLMALAFLSSCEVIGGIFKAGMWVGVIIVVAIIALILWLVGRGRK
jgi:hypothetical protein